MISIKVDLGDVPGGLEQMLGEDLSFTIARFLTMSAQDAQEATRSAEKKVFKLRNDWTVRNTKITPATKKTLTSEVYTDTSNYKSGAPDYLPRQEKGGEKVPVAGHRFLAIPTRYLRRIAPGIIPDALRPKNLLPPGVKIGDQVSGSFASKGEKPRRAVSKASRKKLGNNDFVAFVQHTRSGALCIFVRHGGIGYHGGSHDAEPWYTLVAEAQVKARFPMEKIVQQIAEANAQKNFDRAAAEVLVNRALKSGMRVQF